MEEDILDQPVLATDNPLDSAISWWEKKRLWFNAPIALAGVIPILIYFKHVNWIEIPGAILYGLVANALYCAGFLIEALLKHYFKYEMKSNILRWVFFVIGTLSVAGFTFIAAMGYYFIQAWD